MLVQLTVGDLNRVIDAAVDKAVSRALNAASVTAPYLDVEDTARYFRVDPRTIRNWIGRGAPAAKAGRDYRIRLPDFEKWVNEQRPGLKRIK